MSNNSPTWTDPVAQEHPCLILRHLAMAGCLLCSGTAASEAGSDVQALPAVNVSTQTSEIDALGRVLRIDTDAVRARPVELADLLDQQTSLQVRRSGGFGSFASVSARGTSAQQTSLTLNGLPLAPTVSGDFNLGALSLKHINRIDLYAGHAPIEFAGAGPGGVIDLRSELGSQAWAPSAYASLGSARTWQAGSRTGWDQSHTRHGFSLGAAGSDNDYPIRNPNRAFDPADPDRRREEPRRNADVERWHGLYVGQWQPEQGPVVDTLFQIQSQSQGIPDARNSRTASTRLRSRQANLQARIRWREAETGSPELTTRGYWQASRLRYDDRQDQVGVGAQLTDTRQHQYGADLITRNHVDAPLQWTGLVRVAHEAHRATEQLRQRQEQGSREHLHLGGELRWQHVPTLSLGATLRHQDVEDHFDGAPTASYAATTWQLAGRWSFSPSLQLYANGGRSIRLPTFFERYGDRGLFIGNPALRPESSRNLNLGLAWATLPWRTGIEVYASGLHDAIVTQFDVLSGIGRAENTDSARILGVEAQLSGTWSLGPAGHLNLRLSAAAQDARNTSAGVLDGKQLAGRFRQKAFAGLTWLLPRNYELFYEGLLEHGRFYDSLNSRPAPDARLHHLGLRKTLNLGRHRVDLGGEIRNIGNQRGQDFSAQPQPGRQLFTSIEWMLLPAHHHGTDT